MLTTPEPKVGVEGILHNGDQMPIVLIYLLNYFSKYCIAQFVGEASVEGAAIADPIGVVVAQVFSRPNFLWRGESLIDILMAKYRVACPVVFGVRGNESTEEGRAKIGWHKRKDGSYADEGTHCERMTGLGAGYASICLRDFTKSKLENPWHPTHYWQTISAICETPPKERSITQYVVLRAMIDGYEETFLRFYGNAAHAALAVALVNFPAEAAMSESAVKEASAAVGGVMVLADRLASRGLNLRA